jgi:hypothetical protein
LNLLNLADQRPAGTNANEAGVYRTIITKDMVIGGRSQLWESP